MISFSVNTIEIAKLTEVLDGNGKKLKQQLYIATNKAATKTRSFIAKGIAKGFKAPQKHIRKTIWLRKAKSGVQRKAIITQKDFKGFPLKWLKAKQDAKGVSFVGRKSAGKQRIEGAFMGPKPGVINSRWKGNAYKRLGKERGPLKPIDGPSTWEVFVSLNLEGQAVKYAREQLKKEIVERARFLGLKKSGAI